MAVDVAYDGREAAHQARRSTPTTSSVLDRDLPGIHGDTICRLDRRRATHPAMVLMLTAAGASGRSRWPASALGADDYLAKPFHFPELVLSHPRPRPPQAQPRARRIAPRRQGSSSTPCPPAPPPATAGSLELSAPRSAPSSSALLHRHARPRLTAEQLLLQASDGRRPLHPHRLRHHRTTQEQTRRPATHPHHTRPRLQHHHRQLTASPHPTRPDTRTGRACRLPASAAVDAEVSAGARHAAPDSRKLSTLADPSHGAEDGRLPPDAEAARRRRLSIWSIERRVAFGRPFSIPNPQRSGDRFAHGPSVGRCRQRTMPFAAGAVAGRGQRGPALRVSAIAGLLPWPAKSTLRARIAERVRRTSDRC